MEEIGAWGQMRGRHRNGGIMKIAAYEVREDEREIMERRAQERGIELVVSPEVLDEANVQSAQGADGVTTLGKSSLNAEMLKRLHGMGVKAVATRTMGVDHIDLDAAKQEQMAVYRASYDPDGVAEFTIMLIQMALRHYKQALYRANANDYSLSGLMGKELRNLTVGVVGTGGIGSKVIQILQGFGCRVLAFNRRRVLPDHLEGMAKMCSLEELYRNSDVITLHVPSTKETWHMIDQAAIQTMKDGVVLINCARGSLMSIEDLITGIETQKIGALALDVIEDEDGIYHQDRRSDILINRNMAYIRQFPNVVMTQHMAFYTDAAVKSMAVSGVDNIAAFAEGKETNDRVI